ncbi:MAG: hypothetical protein K6E39_03970 [Lachnospiraceae bacterium]|nr:hypothetical protein [Lachnospiraceae bacterium]
MAENQRYKTMQAEVKESASTYADTQSSSHVKIQISTSRDDELDRKLCAPRSEAYMQAVEMIDVLSATDEEIIENLKSNMSEETQEIIDGMSMEEIREEIKLSFVEEFANMELPQKVERLGIIAECYIGGCDCHAITSEGEILNHFKKSEVMPDDLAKARPIFHIYKNRCKCVEVYTNCCRVVMNDSSVIEIPDVK